jgi:hypothetical protein
MEKQHNEELHILQLLYNICYWGDQIKKDEKGSESPEKERESEKVCVCV